MGPTALVIGATELQRLLVLNEQFPSLSGEQQEKAERKVVTLRSELQRLINFSTKMEIRLKKIFTPLARQSV